MPKDPRIKKVLVIGAGDGGVSADGAAGFAGCAGCAGASGRAGAAAACEQRGCTCKYKNYTDDLLHVLSPFRFKQFPGTSVILTRQCKIRKPNKVKSK